MTDTTDQNPPSSLVLATPPDAALHEQTVSLVPTPPLGGYMSVNGAQVIQATKDLPAEQRDAIRWFHQYAHERNWNCEIAGSKLRRAGQRGGVYDSNTVYQVLRGSYNGKLDNFVGAVQAFRVVAEKRELLGRPDFIETSLTKRLFEICNKALDYQRIALVFGDGQTGKTAAFEEFARRRNHGRTRYLRLPMQAPLRLTTDMLARVCGCAPSNHTIAALRQNVINSFDSHTLLIIDELQQVTLAQNQRNRLLVLELLREIFDRSACGMVICGTNEAMTEFDAGPNSLWLRQLQRRALPIIKLESEPTDEDMLAFAAHYGLDQDVPGDILEQMRRIGRDVGIGQYITYLQGAAQMANTESVPITWRHFARTLKALGLLGQAKRRKTAEKGGN